MTIRFWIFCGLSAILALLPVSGLAPDAIAETTAVEGTSLEGVPDDPELAFQAGIQLYRSGKLEEANNLFLDYLYRYPDTEWLQQIQLFLARIALDQQNDKKALIFIQQIPEPQRSSEAQFIAGVAHVRLGEYAVGDRALTSLQESPLFEGDRILLFSSLGEARAHLGRNLEALYYFNRARELGGDSNRLLARSHELLTAMRSGELEEALLVLDGTPQALDAKLQLARIAVDEGRTLQGRRLITELQQDPTPFPYRGDIPLLLSRLSGGNWLQRHSVGVILPLSGRYTRFGNLAKRGIEMAFEDYRERLPDLKLLYRDSAAEPERSSAAALELANSERVMAILGPLSSEASQAAAERAQMDAVPLLSLSQKEDLPQLGHYIFRNSLTNHLQTRELARYAVQEKGLTAFAVLYPKTHKGEELAAQFARDVKALGGLVVEEAAYDPEGTDFRHQIIPFIGEDLNARKEREEATEGDQPKKLLPPETTFEALFIPDFAEKVAMLLPQLTYYGVENVQLLGSNGWNSPRLLQQAKRYVDGAVMVEGFYRQSSRPAVRSFVERYYQLYSQDPSFIEAQAYDAASILFALLSDPRIESREDLLSALSQLRDFPGITGATAFDRQGEVVKTPFLLQVQKDALVELN